MTSLPEQTAKKTPVPPIVALLSNGCKQALPLLTVDLQRARHNIIYPSSFSMLSTSFSGKYIIILKFSLTENNHFSLTAQRSM
jgi:hypothetical protein